MLINTGVFVYLACLICFLIAAKRYSTDNFSLPMLFICFALAEIPYLFFIYNNSDELHRYVLYNLTDLDTAFFKHILYKFLFVSIAFYFILKTKFQLGFVSNFYAINYLPVNRYRYISLFFCLLTILVFLAFLSKVGGLLNLILNISTKTTAVQGTAFYRNTFLITSMLTVGFYILYLSKKTTILFVDKIALFFLITLCFIILGSSGERKNPMMLLIFAAMSWNFLVAKIKLLTLKNVFLLAFLVFFASLAPVLRKTGAIEIYMESPGTLFIDSFQYIGEVFKRFSEIDISLFIFSHFDSVDKLWFGASLSDFFTGFIPSSIYPEKPPLDEGVYIYALAHGYDVYPPTAFNKMLPVGWPLSRMTGPYVNFGIIGVVVFAALTGIVLKVFENIMIRSAYSPQTILLYCIIVVTNFGLTNAFVFNLLTVIVMLSILTLLIKIRIK
ncbi:O-antigen polymerase [Alteromonas sp. W364]|uniref:O-antigen polymerase n=1 Tax=Alteromonas sp. W364 TaxID=3075610 RepID=UPI002884ADC4|nr:O-antigen polymerase [Alteromonas sp. W364]MDT0627740.1 O-antigen polymerase [Alteromonas sp. W364]